MNMKYMATLLIGVVLPTQVLAQDTTLGTVVAGADNATDLQVRTGDAVQLTCGQMLDRYRPVAGDVRPPTSAEEDLFFRCNEMVTTANALDGNDGPTGNDLGWTSGQLAEAMQQLTGEEQVSKGRLATETSNGQFANIGMRLDAIRAGARSTAGGVNLAMNGTPVVGGNAGEEGDGLGWGWFLNGAYGFGDRDSTQRENEYDFDSYGATLGFDYMFASGLVAGIAAGYADYEVDFDRAASPLAGNSLTTTVSGGGFELDGYSLSGYLIGNIGRFYVDGLVSYGSNDYETERVVAKGGPPAQAPPPAPRSARRSLEAFALAEKFSGRKQVHTYVDQNRAGDHICYYSDLRKMRAHYPAWDLTQSLEETIRQIVASWRQRQSA